MMRAIAVALGVLILPAALLVAINTHLESRAIARAHDLIAEARTVSDDRTQLAVALTARIHADFARPDIHVRWPLVAKLRPLLTHRLLPWPLRMRAGALEVLYPHGQCDSAARALVLVLAIAGFDAAQLNMVTSTEAHSAVIAFLGGEDPVLLDPTYGTVARSDSGLVGLNEARVLMRGGSNVDDIWRSLAPTSNVRFYRRFGESSFARQGEPMDISAEVALSSNRALQLGTPDGGSWDVIVEGAKAGLTPYWGYVGNKYDRAWRRTLTVQQATRVIFGLVQAPDAKFITSDLPAKQLGNELIYELAAGSTLRFVDGRAGYDLLQMRSYVDVDYVRFEPLSLAR